MGADQTIFNFSQYDTPTIDLGFERLGMVSQSLWDFDFSKLPNFKQFRPNVADLCFAKNVVRILRELKCIDLKQSEGLTSLAKALGHKTYAAAVKHAPVYVRNPQECEQSLLPTSLWVLYALGKLDVAQDDEFLGAVVQKAARIPVFQYTYRNIDGHRSREHRIYSAGFLADIGPTQAWVHPLSELGLLAVDYDIITPQVTARLSKEAFFRLPPHRQLEHYQCSFMRYPEAVPRTDASARYEVVSDYLEEGFQYWMKADCLEKLYGIPSIMIGLPDYGCSLALHTSTHRAALSGPESKIAFFGHSPCEENLLMAHLPETQFKDMWAKVDTSMDRLIGSHKTMACYSLRLADSTGEDRYFSFNANAKGRYGAEDDLLEIVSFLQDQFQAQGVEKASKNQIAHHFLKWFEGTATR